MGAAGTMASMIGRLHHLILDCPDPPGPLGQIVPSSGDLSPYRDLWTAPNVIVKMCLSVA